MLPQCCVCVCGGGVVSVLTPCQCLNNLKYFHEVWYEQYATGRRSNAIFLIPYTHGKSANLCGGSDSNDT
jgi:hypothetical protein